MNYIPELGMRAHDLPAHTPEELRECAEKLNIKYIQLALRKSFNTIEWTNHTFTPGLAAKIKEGLGNVRISVLGSYINLLAEGDALEHEKAVFRQNMLFAKYLNVGVVGTETGNSSHTEQDYEKVLKTVRELTADAEKLGVIIGIEGVVSHTINTPQMMRRLLDDVNSPNIMTILDPVNYIDASNYRNQDVIIREAFELLSDKMAAIHLKDFNIVDNRRVGADIGKGMFNIKLLLDCVKKYKPYIDIMLEESSDQSYRKDCEEIIRQAE